MTVSAKLSAEDIDAAAEAIRKEIRTFRVEWFVEDSKMPLEGPCDLTPYYCLAVVALRAAGLSLPADF